MGKEDLLQILKNINGNQYQRYCEPKVNSSHFELKQAVEELIGDWEESVLNGQVDEEGWLAAVLVIDVINRIKGLKIA